MNIKGMTLYKTRDIMNLLQVTKVTVYDWISKGVLKAQKMGGQYRVTEDDLKDFLDRRKSKK